MSTWLAHALAALVLVAMVPTAREAVSGFQQPVRQYDAWSGMVEGFYWAADDSVRDHSGAYTAEQRLQALDFLASGGLNTYIYAPQQVDLMAPLNEAEQAEWRDAFAHAESLGIQLMYGVRPRDPSDFAAVTEKVVQLASLGCKAYVLCFDDVAGASLPEQVALQVDLAASLRLQHPTLQAAFLPGSYHGAPSAQHDALAPLDEGLDVNVAMLLTGTAIVPHSIQLADFPVLPSGRRIVVYDNWAAVDTSKRIAWDLGRSTALPRELFGGGEAGGKWGYVLNPCFPLERIIHQLARLAQLHTESSGTESSGSDVSATNSAMAIGPAAQTWADWLVQHGFADRTVQDAVRSALDSAIAQNQRYESIAELEAAYPALRGVF